MQDFIRSEISVLSGSDILVAVLEFIRNTPLMNKRIRIFVLLVVSVFAGLIESPLCAQNKPYKFVERKAWGAKAPLFLPGGVQGFEPIGKVTLLTVHHTHDLPKNIITEEAKVRYLQHLHIDGVIEGTPTKYGDIAYHYIIGPSGKVYEGRPSNRRADSNTRYVSEAIRSSSKYNTTTRWDDDNETKKSKITYTKGSVDLWRTGGVNKNLDRLKVPAKPGFIGGHLTIVFLGNFDQPADGMPSPQPTDPAKKAFVNLAAEILKEKDLSSRQIVMHRECASTNCPGDGIYEWLRGPASPKARGERNLGPGIKAVEGLLIELQR